MDQPSGMFSRSRYLAKRRGSIGGVEGKEQDAKLARIGCRIGQHFLELIDILHARSATASVDRQQDERETGEFRQLSRAAGLIRPMDRSNGASALRCDVDNAAVPARSKREQR